MKLMPARFPRALAELAHSNQFLKISNLISFGLSFLMLILALYQAGKAPTVLTLSPEGLPYIEVKPPKAEEEISLAVRRYIALRYKWEPSTVAERLKAAEVFILPQNRKSFEAAVADVIRFATTKGVSQRAYPDDPRVDLDKKIVTITGDRNTTLQGLKAAGDLRLELSFESGPRTQENPWGIYITKEKE